MAKQINIQNPVNLTTIQNFLSQRPEIKYFEGSNYQNNNNKVLFIGKGHYIEGINLNQTNFIKTPIPINDWYNSLDVYNEIVTMKLEENINTKDIIEKRLINNSNPPTQNHLIYQKVAEVYAQKYNLSDFRIALEEIAFTNAFLRPAINIKSLKNINSIDKNYTLGYVDFLIGKLRPKKIFLLHKDIEFIKNYVQNNYQNQNINIDRVICPRKGWNNNQKGGQKLLSLL
jgi:hypothetical protein